jgi:hypothetical protein
MQWPCDLEAPHPTLAHRNKKGKVVWCSHYEAIRNAPPKQVITPQEAGIQ